MEKSTRNSRGFTLIAALLLTLLLSGLAVGMLYLVTNEQRMGNNDLENNLAYYGAESGIENLTAQLSILYQSSQTPTAASLNALTAATNWPSAVTGSNITNMVFTPSISWPPNQSNGLPCTNAPNPCGSWDIVGSGSDQGMVASLIPFTLGETATRLASAGEVTNNAAIAPTGASVNLTRTVEVALLPAFEFGVFCDGDCDYFAGPNFSFGGRVHTNGNLFLASGANLTFTDKIAAVGQVITDQLENGWPTSNQYTGNVWVPDASLGCPASPTPGPGSSGFCLQLSSGSWAGGFPPLPPIPCPACGGAATSTWTGTSENTFANFIENGLTGATKLSLPFVQSSNVGPVEIIRKPTPNDSSLLLTSRLYTKAQIRILLADTQADLHPDRPSPVPLDANDVQLTGSVADILLSGSPSMYYGMAKSGTGSWVLPTATGCASPWPLLGEVTASTPCQSTWLRVEYLNATSGLWTGVTQQWLSYGFGRSYNMPPTHPYNASNGATSVAPYCPTGSLTWPITTANWPPVTANDPLAQCQNPISPAIIILQQLQNGMGASSATGATSVNNWLPINFYDAREGEPRDSRPGGDPETSCSPSGVMNAVEIDVGNLWLWLQGSAPYGAGSGLSVNNTTNSGYILYFSDHRGMLPDAYPINGAGSFYNNISGMSGLNDTVNAASTTGVPDGTLEPMTYYIDASPTPYSSEDTAIKGAGVLGTHVDKWGEADLGMGFGLTGAAISQPYYISGTTAGISSCSTNAEWNMVTGARHVLRLVDASMDNLGNSYLPHPTAPNSGDGFTVASEEPVYVYGDYNTGPDDPLWATPSVATTPHSAAAIIADAVTLLSNPPSGSVLPAPTGTNPVFGWTDHASLLYPGQAVLSGSFPGRQGNTSYYRVAIAAGKSIPFPETSYSIANGWKDFGTDGGMHNFLRYLEDRSDNGNGATVNYAGSLINMYYSQYATGIFKCCNSTYSAPVRNYFFDTQFLNPNNLPPGTPMFQDVVSLSYHQNFTPQ
jgi:hypothetical protein